MTRYLSPVLLTVACTLLLAERPARAGELEDRVEQLGSAESERVAEAANRLGELGDPRAIAPLEALADDRLAISPSGHAFIRTKTGVVDAVTLLPAEPGALHSAELDNSSRRMVLPVLAQLKLTSPSAEVRLSAAEELAKRPREDAVPGMRKALAGERDGKVIEALSLALAQIDLQSDDTARKLAALQILQRLGSTNAKTSLLTLLKKNDAGAYVEPSSEVREAASKAMHSIESTEMLVGMVGNFLYGLSLASVLLFAALGLAITFGLMGVINMAHGEMLMIGAYTTYGVQGALQSHAPSLLRYYVLFAIPAAFLVCGLAGMALERSIIRFLYGRPLETLLATWGISLLLIQTVRLLFGAQNVAVANPNWLAGGKEIFTGIVLPYNRIGVVVFVVLVALFMWLLLQKTRLGLQLRAVTQNRSMAACMGISTARIDMMTFGLGSAIAGLGGVALSQLGNVGPELGQGYIVDAFMVVVLGGVGRIAGTIWAAISLGILNKVLEPFAGAVLGKIAVLVLIILFIQKRPQGIFAMKGRVES